MYKIEIRALGGAARPATPTGAIPLPTGYCRNRNLFIRWQAAGGRYARPFCFSCKLKFTLPDRFERSGVFDEVIELL